MSSIITTLSNKGGVGKSCIAINLAASLSTRFSNIAIIDKNPSNNTINSHRHRGLSYPFELLTAKDAIPADTNLIIDTKADLIDSIDPEDLVLTKMVLKKSNVLLLVTSDDPATFEPTEYTLARLEQLEKELKVDIINRVLLVISSSSDRVEDRKDLAKVIRARQELDPTIFALPHDKKLAKKVFKGELPSLVDSASAYAKDMALLADYVATKCNMQNVLEVAA